MDTQLLSTAADVVMSRIARATTHVGHRRPRGQFETLAELAYCALYEEQFEGAYSLSMAVHEKCSRQFVSGCLQLSAAVPF